MVRIKLTAAQVDAIWVIMDNNQVDAIIEIETTNLDNETVLARFDNGDALMIGPKGGLFDMANFQQANKE